MVPIWNVCQNHCIWNKKLHKKDTIINEGHNSYYIDTIIAYVSSLIDVINLYRPQVLQSCIPTHADTQNSAVKLSGNQLVLFAMFTNMLKQRDSF